MGCIKFSLLGLLLTAGTVSAQMRFSPKSCLDSDYKMTMIQKGPLFGLLKHEFTINKKSCIIQVTHNRYIPKEWIIDVCREPVHIKVLTATGVDVAKKTAQCESGDKSKDTSDFCSQYQDLVDVIQDDGLIFAEGDRDNLSSNHGKTFCSYLLLQKYLNESVVFSRYSEVPDIFIDAPRPASAPPVPKLPEKTDLEKKDDQARLETGNAVTSTF
jgi:hypothetical protein